MLGVSLDKQLEHRLEELASKRQRSKTTLAEEAVRRYIEEEERKEQENELAKARWQEFQENGEVAAHEDVENWLNSWGTEQEQPWTGQTKKIS